jgi:hypothetical protein
MHSKLDKPFFWFTTIGYILIVGLLFYGSLTKKVIINQPTQNVAIK